VLCAGKLSGESADVVVNMLESMQVDIEDRDVAIRLLKTGRCVGNSMYLTTFIECVHLHISVSVMSGNSRKSQQFRITYYE
jgi:hypothetical protein